VRETRVEKNRRAGQRVLGCDRKPVRMLSGFVSQKKGKPSNREANKEGKVQPETSLPIEKRAAQGFTKKSQKKKKKAPSKKNGYQMRSCKTHREIRKRGL